MRLESAIHPTHSPLLAASITEVYHLTFYHVLSLLDLNLECVCSLSRSPGVNYQWDISNLLQQHKSSLCFPLTSRASMQSAPRRELLFHGGIVRAHVRACTSLVMLECCSLCWWVATFLLYCFSASLRLSRDTLLLF